MTERYLVMPRGINVGTRNRVPMAQLRSKLADAGYSDVATVLQSGNVIVSTESAMPDEVAGAMQRLLSDEFDVDVACVVRTANQVRRVLNRNPLQEVVSDPSRYLVNFLSEEPDPEAAGALLKEDHSPEAIAIEGTEAYVWTPHGVKAMTLSYAYLEQAARRRRHRAQLEHLAEDRREVLIADRAAVLRSARREPSLAPALDTLPRLPPGQAAGDTDDVVVALVIPEALSPLHLQELSPDGSAAGSPGSKQPPRAPGATGPLLQESDNSRDHSSPWSRCRICTVAARRCRALVFDSWTSQIWQSQSLERDVIFPILFSLKISRQIQVVNNEQMHNFRPFHEQNLTTL